MTPSPPLTPRRVNSGPTQQRRRSSSRPSSGSKSAGALDRDAHSSHSGGYADDLAGDDALKPAHHARSSRENQARRTKDSRSFTDADQGKTGVRSSKDFTPPRDSQRRSDCSTKDSVNDGQSQRVGKDGVRIRSKDKTAMKNLESSSRTSNSPDKVAELRASLESCSRAGGVAPHEESTSMTSSGTWDTSCSSFDRSGGGGSAFDTSASRSTADEGDDVPNGPANRSGHATQLLLENREVIGTEINDSPEIKNLQKNSSSSSKTKPTSSSERMSSSRNNSGNKRTSIEESKIEKITKDKRSNNNTTSQDKKNTDNKKSTRSKNNKETTIDTEQGGSACKDDRLELDNESADNRYCDGSSSSNSSS